MRLVEDLIIHDILNDLENDVALFVMMKWNTIKIIELIEIFLYQMDVPILDKVSDSRLT